VDGVVARGEVLAIVQARGGSKGLPRKNLRLLKGHPLLAYSIASGLAAEAITRVIISTDDEEIAEVAKAYGAQAPFQRPAALAEDDTPDFPLFEHALDWLEKNEGYRPDVIVQLRPTTPFRPRGMLDEAVHLLEKDAKADCVRGVTPPKQTPYKMWRNAPGGYLAPLMETEFAEPYNMPRQKLPAAFWQTGHVDAIRTSTIREKHSLTGSRVLPILVDQDYCVDIDTLADFDVAERILEQKRLDIDLPRMASGSGSQRMLPAKIGMLVFDFDGVFTDNRVIVFDDGREAVICNRGDGMGLALLREHGIGMAVLSTEKNRVVEARCRKLGMDFEQGLSDKVAVLRKLAAQKQVGLASVIYVGNDVNDLECMQAVGFAVAPADAHHVARQHADLVLTNPGGFGAVRELCDIIIEHLTKNKHGAGH